jgi:hypothetical protein
MQSVVGEIFNAPAGKLDTVGAGTSIDVPLALKMVNTSGAGVANWLLM